MYFCVLRWPSECRDLHRHIKALGGANQPLILWNVLTGRCSQEYCSGLKSDNDNLPWTNRCDPRTGHRHLFALFEWEVSWRSELQFISMLFCHFYNSTLPQFIIMTCSNILKGLQLTTGLLIAGYCGLTGEDMLWVSYRPQMCLECRACQYGIPVNCCSAGERSCVWVKFLKIHSCVTFLSWKRTWLKEDLGTRKQV